MGLKIWVVGVTLIFATRLLAGIPAVDVVGEVLAIIGAILYCLDK